ncbi:hypothetical protein SAZ10_17550 [Mesorhizobium sp. BAC0120]|uniref:hypothetical protein n=1 Tax=Mesorhizobium sp. BAC0120 TaxID=3090670 RepID=UPI00298C5DBB|nr:hypothetical protein [Mesorhizobium sp. BAC0120]MDW6023558.1 hypothetical protein [Mesorhizobium sp. BAC0120]
MTSQPVSHSNIPLARPKTRAFRIPTDEPEADGTIDWNATTLVVVELDAGGESGLGYGYAITAACEVIDETLGDVIEGEEAFDIPDLWTANRAAGSPRCR